MKFGPSERGFRIRAARKMGREQKGGRSGVVHFFALALFFVQPECEKNSFARPQFRSRGTGTLATQATLESFIETFNAYQ